MLSALFIAIRSPQLLSFLSCLKRKTRKKKKGVGGESLSVLCMVMWLMLTLFTEVSHLGCFTCSPSTDVIKGLWRYFCFILLFYFSKGDDIPTEMSGGLLAKTLSLGGIKVFLC